MPKIGQRWREKHPLTPLLREIRAESDHRLELARKLTGRGIPVGGAHLDEFLVGESLAAFLREFYRSSSPEAALRAGSDEARLIVEKWNKSRKDYQVHRWLESGLDKLYWAYRLIKSVRSQDRA